MGGGFVGSPLDEQFAEAVRRHQAGDTPGAEQLYRAILAGDSRHFGALSNLGVILAKKDPQEAVRLYTAAIDAAPGRIDAHFNLGNLYRKLGQLQDAANAYHAVLRIDPNNARAYLNLGLAVSDSGDWTQAVDLFRQAVHLDPTLPEAHNLLGDALNNAGRIDDAIAVFREFIARCPDDPRGHHNLGFSLAAKGEYETAIPELERSLQLRPNHAETHNLLGVAYEALGRTDDAQSHYRQTVAVNPDHAEAWSNLGTSLNEQGRAIEAIEALRKSFTLRSDPRVGDNLLLALGYSSDLSSEQLRDEHLRWAARFADPLAPREPPPRVIADPDRRLKIGYVSADFRTHTVAGFAELLLTHHDRVHVTCYSNVMHGDETTARLRRLADSWRPIAGIPDTQAAEMIRQDEIDILLDLSGHTAGNRLLLFARKPAPVQATLFGYPTTTGIKAIDLRITDPFADPPGETESLCVEKLVRLPEVAWTYRAPAAAPVANALPSQSRSTFTFGCLNNAAKLSQACVAAWARILEAVPRSRIVLLIGRSSEAARLTAERFRNLGVAADRLELVYRLPPDEYFEAYQTIDLALDPFPYNGGVTTCDALWMGVPVLSVAGRDYRSRQGVSLLNNVGLPEFVADSPDRLVELAASWSDERDALADLRASLREMMQASPITQAENYVRNLESALRTAWQESLG
jgi:protein O-GlcNAc transferase